MSKAQCLCSTPRSSHLSWFFFLCLLASYLPLSLSHTILSLLFSHILPLFLSLPFSFNFWRPHSRTRLQRKQNTAKCAWLSAQTDKQEYDPSRGRNPVCELVSWIGLSEKWNGALKDFLGQSKDSGFSSRTCTRNGQSRLQQTPGGTVLHLWSFIWEKFKNDIKFKDSLQFYPFPNWPSLLPRACNIPGSFLALSWAAELHCNINTLVLYMIKKNKHKTTLFFVFLFCFYFFHLYLLYVLVL